MTQPSDTDSQLTDPIPTAARDNSGQALPTSPMAQPRRAAPSSITGWFIALLACTTLFSFYHLSGGAGFEPTDCWVSQTAREMSESETWRGYVVPTFSGEIRTQKSPGPYWAVVAVSWLRGTPVDEVATRIPNAISAVLLVAVIFWLTRHIAGDRAALFAGFASASSLLVLYWSHRGASDLGVAALMTLSLAALWIGTETAPPGKRRIALWMLGYLAAGLAMLYKMPMPLVCVGLPAVFYVLLCNRWRIFASWWHAAGLLLFLLPWLPWAITFVIIEPRALDKWRVEFLDRVTGDLPNVAGQQTDWRMYLLYIGVAFVFAVPYCLSIPQAIGRAFLRREGVNRRGTWFLLIWFFSLLAFFTASAGKETRYFLPAMPPLLILLGIELSRFFDPTRIANAARDKIGLILTCIAAPAVFIVVGWQISKRLAQYADYGLPAWDELRGPYIVAAAIFSLGLMTTAWLYTRRREHASFAALVCTMWVMWLWVWPNVMPIVVSQAPFKDFAAQLRALPPEHQARLKQIAHQDSRITWYADVRFPRLVDPLELLKMQNGRRDIEFEERYYGRQMIETLEADEPALFVSGPLDYVKFHALAPRELEKENRTMPATYVWSIARTGQPLHRYVLYGNKPPPWPPPETAWLDELVSKFAKRLAAEPEPAEPTDAPDDG